MRKPETSAQRDLRTERQRERRLDPVYRARQNEQARERRKVKPQKPPTGAQRVRRNELHRIRRKANPPTDAQRDRDNKRARDAYMANPGKFLERLRISHAANPGVGRKRVHKWKADNPERVRENHIRRRARKAGAEGSYTASEWKSLCSTCGDKCLRCSASGRLTVDHVVPLSRGGRNDVGNLQPLCGPCNSSKGTRTIDYRRPRPDVTGPGTWRPKQSEMFA